MTKGKRVQSTRLPRRVPDGPPPVENPASGSSLPDPEAHGG